jgi:ATP-binding cassette subfamily F protein uup
VVVSPDRAFHERPGADVRVLDGEGRAGRRPGGYQALDAERRATAGGRSARSVTGPPASTGSAGKAPAPAAAPGDRPARTPSTLRRLLKEAEKELAKLERERARLEDEVHRAAAGNDHAELARLGADLADLQGRVAAVEERWLALGEELEART